jgi:hypothetical protein
MRLGTVEGLDVEAARAREVVAGALADQPASSRTASSFRRHSCSRVSRGNGEELIGSAKYFDRWLLVELPLPWPPGMGTAVWETPRVPEPLRAALRTATRRTADIGLEMKTMGAAPDPEYSRDGYTRVMRLDPIPGPTAGLTRCEYVVPDDDAPALIDALFGEDPSPLRRFADARVDLAVRDLIVCTHASVDACCGTFGYPLFQAQRERHGSGGQVRVWRVSSFGGHRFAPSPIDLPEGRFWGNVEVERMAEIVDRAAPAKQALDMYRGWACLRIPAEQVLERELLDRHGWEWIGRELDLAPIDGSDVVEVVAGTERYEATVEHCSSVPVLIGCDGTAGQVERYSMTALRPMIPVPS